MTGALLSLGLLSMSAFAGGATAARDRPEALGSSADAAHGAAFTVEVWFNPSGTAPLHASSYDWHVLAIQRQTFRTSETPAVRAAPTDVTAPLVTVVSALPQTLGAADLSTTIVWNADENGSFTVRVGGVDCVDGTQVGAGGYGSAPADTSSSVAAADLAEGPNTVRVCVSDAAGNSGSATVTVTKGMIVFRAASSATNAVATTLVLPTPAGVLAGDVLLAAIDVIAAPAVTAPAGWALVRSNVSGNGATAIRQSVYVHVAGPSELPAYTWSLASPHGASGGILAYTGVDTTSPVAASSGAVANGAKIAAPSVTTTAANSMVVGLFGMNGQRTVTPPTSMTERFDLALGSPAGEKVMSEAADVLQATAGPSGAKTANASASGRGVGQLVALRPKSGAPTPDPPVIDSVVIGPSSPRTNDLLSATVTGHDPDGGSITYSYQWTKNGADISGASGPTLDLSISGNGDRGDAIALRVVAGDGAYSSAPTTSSSVVVVNSPPTATVLLSDTTPSTDDLLTATATVNDADGDAVVLTYVWKVNGVPRQTTTTASLTDIYDLSQPGNGAEDDLVTVDLTPSDGFGDGALATATADVGPSAEPVGTITEFPVPSGSGPSGIATGPDGNVWFTEENSSKVGRITPSGTITRFSVPTPGSLGGITGGPDGNVWFTEFNGNKVARITPSGTITEFPVPTSSAGLAGITTGPDGNLWFAEASASKIGRMTPSGTVTAEFQTPTPSAWPHGINPGPDGNIWFVELTKSKIGRITPTGVFAEFPIPTPSSNPRVIVAGPDGNLWFTEFQGNRIGRITTSGSIVEFLVPTASAQPVGITAGPDGNLWFTEQQGNKIGRITPGGVITEFPVPTPSSGPNKITVGPDGNLWFTERNADKIARLKLNDD